MWLLKSYTLGRFLTLDVFMQQSHRQVGGIRSRRAIRSASKWESSQVEWERKEVSKDLIKAHPHAPKRVLALLAETTGKTISSSSLRRLAKRDGLRWKRVRKSAKSKRDDQAFAEGEKELKTLKKTPGRRAWSVLFWWSRIFSWALHSLCLATCRANHRDSCLKRQASQCPGVLQHR